MILMGMLRDSLNCHKNSRTRCVKMLTRLTWNARVCVLNFLSFFLLFWKMIKWLLDSILHVNLCVCVFERKIYSMKHLSEYCKRVKKTVSQTLALKWLAKHWKSGHLTYNTHTLLRKMKKRKKNSMNYISIL